jgi:hypothetical protein
MVDTILADRIGRERYEPVRVAGHKITIARSILS